MSSDTPTPEGAQPEGGNWKAPSSQEELDSIIEKRLARERAKFADYDDVKAKAEEFDKAREAEKSELEKLTARAESAEAEVQKYQQRDQVSAWAKEIVEGSTIPASALRGATREELEAHFEDLKQIAAPTTTPAPKRPPASGAASGEPAKGDEAMRGLARSLFGQSD